MAVAGAQLVAVVLGDADRAPDQVGVVDRAHVVEDHQVALHEAGGDDVRILGPRTELLEVDRVEALLAGPGQHRLHLRGEPARANGGTQRLGPGQ